MSALSIFSLFTELDSEAGTLWVREERQMKRDFFFFLVCGGVYVWGVDDEVAIFLKRDFS